MSKQAEEAGRLADAKLDELLNARGDTETASGAPKSTNDATPDSAQEHRETEGFWKQKYETLNGKYLAEVPILHDQIRKTKAESSSLSAQVQALTAENTALKSQGAVASAPQRNDDIESIRNVWGDEIAETMGGMRQQIVDLQGQVSASKGNEQTHKTAEKEQEWVRTAAHDQGESFVVAMCGGEKEFHAIDDDPAFTAWLQEFDPRLGKTRHQQMGECYRNLQFDKVGAFFTTYRDLARGMSAKKNTRDDREEYIEPSAKVSGMQNSEGKKIYSAAEVEQIQKDLATNKKYRTVEGSKLATAMEEELLQAALEGRIRKR